MTRLLNWIASWDMWKSDKERIHEWLGQSHDLVELERRQRLLDRKGLNIFNI